MSTYQLRPHQTAHNKGQLCGFVECGRSAFCRGVCRKHYRRWKGLKDRAWAYVARGEEGECWAWSGGNFSDGRPCLTHRGIETRSASKAQRTKTHALRLIKLLELGPLAEPPNEEVGHLCHNDQCVNPRHGEWMSHRENMAMEAGGMWHERRGLEVPVED